MTGRIILSITVLLCCLATSGVLQAQTAEELTSRGLSHFNKAYYEATPSQNKPQMEIEYELAENAFRSAIQKRPDRVEAYLYLARTYYVQKKYSQAAETYRAALKVDPNQKAVYLKLASAQEKSGDYAGAIHTLQRLRIKT